MLKKILYFSFFFIAQVPVFSQSFDQAIISSDRLISTYVKECKIVGLSISVYYKGIPVWKKHYGYSNLEYSIPVSDSSKFRIASVSKNLTGTAIYLLSRDGKLNLDDSISKFLDSVPDAWKNITIRQIAQHTSGIAHYIDPNDALDVRHYNTVKESLGKFMSRPLKHLPDQGVTYSSYGYTVLAAVIEKVTGKTFLDAMKSILFDPFGMRSTEADMQQSIIKGRTGFYQYGKNRNAEQSPYIDLSGRWAGSGFLSTAEDLGKFGAAHTFSSKVFSRKDLDVLTAPRKINDTLSSVEGLGWGQRRDWDKRLMYWGDGSTPGSKCGVLVFPEQDLTISIVSNMRGAPLERSEFQIISSRFLAAIEGSKVKELESNDYGIYPFTFVMNNQTLKGEINIKSDGNVLGTFDFNGMQTFKIDDAYWKNGELWFFAVGTGGTPIQLGIIPIKIKMNGKSFTGEILRIPAAGIITGERK